MDREQLIKIIGDSLNPESSNYQAARAAAASWPDDVSESVFYHEVSKPIEEVLLTEPPFERGQGFMVGRDNGYSGFYAREAAVAITRRYLRDKSPDACLDWSDT